MTTKTPAPSKEGARRRLALGVLQGNMGYLTRVARSVVKQSSRDYVGDMGLAAGQLTLLGLIAANAGVTQNELAGALLIRKSQVTGLIQDLVARGYVSREEMGADRRYNTLSLTPQGRRVWRSARDRIARHSAAVLGTLTAEERDELLRLLRKVIAANLHGVDFAFD